MPRKPLPTPEYLAECFSYDAETGVLRWRERPREHFRNQAAFTTHARTKAGNVAGCIDGSTGYLVVGLNYQLLYAHRIAWTLLHREWPHLHIDHIDGDKLNNRASNLRCVSPAENCRNAPIKRSNRSGIQGIGFAKREGKWRARIMRDYKDIHLGYFDTWADAVDARARALEQYGFHENHGRFE